VRIVSDNLSSPFFIISKTNFLSAASSSNFPYSWRDCGNAYQTFRHIIQDNKPLTQLRFKHTSGAALSGRPDCFPAQVVGFLTRKNSNLGLRTTATASRLLVDWCSGIPGARENFLASLVIHYILSIFSVNVQVVYVFCDYRAQSQQTSLDLISSITR
jgi:hypothetical protein